MFLLKSKMYEYNVIYVVQNYMKYTMYDDAIGSRLCFSKNFVNSVLLSGSLKYDRKWDRFLESYYKNYKFYTYLNNNNQRNSEYIRSSMIQEEIELQKSILANNENKMYNKTLENNYTIDQIECRQGKYYALVQTHARRVMDYLQEIKVVSLFVDGVKIGNADYVPCYHARIKVDLLKDDYFPCFNCPYGYHCLLVEIPQEYIHKNLCVHIEIEGKVFVYDKDKTDSSSLALVAIFDNFRDFKGKHRFISKKFVCDMFPILSENIKYKLSSVNGEKFIVTLSGQIYDMNYRNSIILDLQKPIFYYNKFYTGVQIISENEVENVEYVLESLDE